ncbi:MAG TPA: hypothetical protein VGZ02_15770 [Candidatus Baltobacteraceae bacterium]|jgi:hypothetical protein|nr:hypothetical protein [Candidatus Baltobacteraceae bacterium]
MNLQNVNWRKAGWIAGGLLLLWVIVGVILAGREPGGNLPGSTPITLHGGRVTGSRISTRSWNFDYTSAQMSPDGTEATVEGVKNGILYRKGKPYLRIAAQHVEINTQTFDFSAIGDVHIAAIDPKDGLAKSFDTDLVQWTNATKMLELAHPSIVRTNGQVLKVASISVNFNTNEAHMGRISGSVEAPEK